MNATPAARFTLEFRAEFAAPPERVFAALTEARHLMRWFCDEAVSETGPAPAGAPGGRLMLRWNRPQSSKEAYEGRWTVFDPPRACDFEGGHAGYPEGYAGHVHCAFAPQEGGTVLQVWHEFPSRQEYEPFVARFLAAWPRALRRLGAYLTPSLQPGPFMTRVARVRSGRTTR